MGDMARVTRITQFEEKHWRNCRKRPVEVQFREPFGTEYIHTREGILVANYKDDLIIKGVDGEEYPIKRSIFAKTYDVLDGE